MQPHRDDRERLNEVFNDIKRAAIAGEPAAGRLKPQSVASIASPLLLLALREKNRALLFGLTTRRWTKMRSFTN